MCQQGTGAVKVIVAMVIAGLIVYGIIFYGPEIWRGNQEGASDGDGGFELLSPSEVRGHPNEYLGEEIIIEGIYGPPALPRMLDENRGCLGERFPPNEDISKLVGVEASGVDIELIDGGRYRIRGILRQTSIESEPQLFLFNVPVILIATQAEPR